VCTAFATTYWQWLSIVENLRTGKDWWKNFFFAIKLYTLITEAVLWLLAITATALSCICDGNVCPYELPDYIYFIGERLLFLVLLLLFFDFCYFDCFSFRLSAWQIINGLSIICCISVASYVLVNLKKFKTRHRDRIRHFSVFIICIALTLILLLAYTISLFINYGTTAEGND
jgi:hypothetical protein